MGCCRRGGRPIVIWVIGLRVFAIAFLASAVSAKTPWWFVKTVDHTADSDTTAQFAADQLYLACDKKGSSPAVTYSCDDWTLYTDNIGETSLTFKSLFPKIYDVYQGTKGLSAASLAFCVISAVVSIIQVFSRRAQWNASLNIFIKHTSWMLDCLVIILIVANLGKFTNELPDSILKDCKSNNPDYSTQDCYDRVPGAKDFAGSLDLKSDPDEDMSYKFGPEAAYACGAVALVLLTISAIVACFVHPTEGPKAPVAPSAVVTVVGPYQHVGAEGGAAYGATQPYGTAPPPPPPQPYVYSSASTYNAPYQYQGAPPPGYYYAPPSGQPTAGYGSDGRPSQ